MKEIKSLLREAEVYRDQELLQEAIEKYKIASELILKNDKIKNRQNLLHVISKKMGALEYDFKKKCGSVPRKMPEKTQELIKSKKELPRKTGRVDTSLEDAVNMVKSGQYKRALKELQNLISVDSVRVVAAKNIIRCNMGLFAPDNAIDQYNKWVSDKLFRDDQLKKVRSFLKNTLMKKGIKKDLPERKEIRKPQYHDFEEKDEEVPDISSIVINLNKGSRKAKAIELDVSSQSGNIINVIMSDKEHRHIKNLNIGFKITDIQFFSPIAIFNGSGIVSSMTQIKSGPKKGDYSLDIKVVTA